MQLCFIALFLHDVASVAAPLKLNVLRLIMNFSISFQTSQLINNVVFFLS